MKKEILIEGMSCKHCVKHVTEALAELKGVKDVQVSLEQKKAVVEVDNVDDATLKQAVEEVGYDVIKIA
jgi:copper chaperone